MNQVSLSEIATINPRIPRPLLEQPEVPVSFLAMSSVSEEGRVTSEEERPLGEVAKGYTYFERGDVLLAKITPCMENGKAVYLETLRYPIGFGSTEFHVLRPGPDVDGRYLFYCIWNPRFRSIAERNMTGSAGQKRVPSDFLARYIVPLPPLREQKRIAAILDKADAIRLKRQQAIALTEDLLRSTFLGVVGPGAEGYEGWPRVPVAGLAEARKGAIRSGPFGSALRHSEFADSGIAVLGIDNAVKNRFEWAERRFVTESKYQKLKRYTVFPGDVLITIMGTTGRSAVVPDDIPSAITTKHLATITVQRELVEPEFLSHAIHMHPDVLQQIGSANRGAIMAGLNLGLIRKLEIPLPPVATQRRFVTALSRLRSLQKKLARSLPGDLFGALSERALTGELPC